MTVGTDRTATMFRDAVQNPSQTEVIIEQSKFKALQGLWSIRNDFDRSPDEAFDFFLGGILGSAMMLAKLEFEEQERINSRCAYYEAEFAFLDDDGNLIDPPAEG